MVSAVAGYRAKGMIKRAIPRWADAIGLLMGCHRPRLV